MPSDHKAVQARTSKPTVIPEKSWDVISEDFVGPYPDGHYNLVAIDKKTRYPEVARVSSTSFPQTKEKLKTIFATHGTPRQLESDNGPPFQSKHFAEFHRRRGSPSPSCYARTCTSKWGSRKFYEAPE